LEDDLIHHCHYGRKALGEQVEDKLAPLIMAPHLIPEDIRRNPDRFRFFSTVAMAGKDFRLRMALAVRLQDSPLPKRYKVISRPVSPILYTRTTPEINNAMASAALPPRKHPCQPGFAQRKPRLGTRGRVVYWAITSKITAWSSR
jgi:hypothetical protein